MWPAVVLHSSHNLFVQSVFDKMTVNKSYTQYITSEFGIELALCYAVVQYLLCIREGTSRKKNCEKRPKTGKKNFC